MIMLDRKLLRDLWALKSQACTIALVVAAGLGAFIAQLSEAFAKARQLKPGDRLTAVLNGKRETLEIVGIVLSPEYIFSARGGTIPDENSFGVFWMDRQYLATAFDMAGAFNHAVLRLVSNASEPGVIDTLDRLLAPYGSLGAHGRDEQISHRILNQEIAQQKTMATVFPTIFLGVAAFLLHMVLSRQVATQREHIATLKALGYANVTIAIHYLKLVRVIVVLGIGLGLVLGAWLGYGMTALYAEFFHFGVARASDGKCAVSPLAQNITFLPW
jgi:putative ABC transport system permease protein